MIHPLIIGAGGVASYLLPVLLKTFYPQAITIIDKDVLEERNLDRQMFHRNQIGKNKAEALLDICGSQLIGIPTTSINDWFDASTTIPDSVDAIICVADNHEARRNALDRAVLQRCHCYIGGNEYLDSQAYVYHEVWAGTERDPFKRYPEIRTSNEGSPMRNCTGEAQISDPQLAIANMACAAKLLHLMWVYERWLPENRLMLSQQAIDCLPYELFTSLNSNTQVP